MDFAEYQKETHKTAIFPKEKAMEYLALGLVGEAGEIANKLKKVIRDKKEIDPKDLERELGDVLWYVSELATLYKLSLDGVAFNNIGKLAARQAKGTISGSGDTR